jgi:60 kDa SS-A/Ro ribonucleoprotein
MYRNYSKRHKDGLRHNNGGGMSYVVDKWTRLERFLIIGSASTYYANSSKLTEDNADVVLECARENPKRTLKLIGDISDSGRAPSNDPALFALALVSTTGAHEDFVSTFLKTVRTGSHLLTIANFINDMRGWGRMIRRAFAAWYNTKDAVDYQIVKYGQRGGMSHRDVLRLAHVKPASVWHDRLFGWTVGKENPNTKLTVGYELLKDTNDARRAIAIIEEYGLPRSIVPGELWKFSEAWEALMPNMGLWEIVRNLGTITRSGYFDSRDNVRSVAKMLTDRTSVIRSRIHPITVLSALVTYSNGEGIRGSNSWDPIGHIISALDEMFYLAFDNVEPTGKRICIALDVSSSMTFDNAWGGLTPREISAAMAMITMRIEDDWDIIAFSKDIVPLKLHDRMSLGEIIAEIRSLNFGATACDMPMVWAMEKGLLYDAFVIYTDNETNVNKYVPADALRMYREQSGVHNAKLLVAATTATEFSIADPNDPGMIDIVGFDANVPGLISNFVGERNYVH